MYINIKMGSAQTLAGLLLICLVGSIESQLSQQCLACICQASTGCDLSRKCHNDGQGGYFCGPYQISWSYWADGGRPGDSGGPHDFENCLTDKSCAERAINGYMAKYSRDCNNDGIIDCSDYAAIHKAGSGSCNAQWLLNSDYWRIYQSSPCSNGGYSDNRSELSPVSGAANRENYGQPQPQPQPQSQPQPTWSYSGPINRTFQPVQPSYGQPQPVNRPAPGYQPETPSYTGYNNPQPAGPRNPPRHEVFGPTGGENYEPVNRQPEAVDGTVLRPYPADSGGLSSGIDNNRPSSQPAVNAGNNGFVADNRGLSGSSSSSEAPITGPVTADCLECLCQASTGCDINKQCTGNVCGPYLLSWPFWADSGRPGTDYVSCALRKSCAESSIQGYMTRYARDCNGDGIVNCDDYAIIHQYGPNCGPGQFGTSKFWEFYKTCQAPPIDARSNPRLSPLNQPNLERFRPIERPGQPTANLRRDERRSWNGNPNARLNDNEIPGIPFGFHDADEHGHSTSSFNPFTFPTRAFETRNDSNIYFNDNFSIRPFNQPNQPRDFRPEPPRANGFPSNQPGLNIFPSETPRPNGFSPRPNTFQPTTVRFESGEPRPGNEFQTPPSVSNFQPEPARPNGFRPVESPRPFNRPDQPREFQPEPPRSNGFQPSLLETNGFRPIINRPELENQPGYATPPPIGPSSPVTFEFTTPRPDISQPGRFTPRYERPNIFDYPTQPPFRPYSVGADNEPVTTPTTTPSPLVTRDDSSLLPGPRDLRLTDNKPNNFSMSSECFDCICEATSKCDPNMACSLYSGTQHCGPYQISISYWLQAGKPGYNEGTTDFINCVNNMDCAKETLKGYIKTMARDCNNDGSIDCVDFALIHRLGPNSCSDQAFLDSPYWNDFQSCYGFER